MGDERVLFVCEGAAEQIIVETLLASGETSMAAGTSDCRYQYGPAYHKMPQREICGGEILELGL